MKGPSTQNCPKVGHTVHTIGQSDDLFRSSGGASVSSCPTLEHSGDNFGRSDEIFGKIRANDGRSGAAESLKCPVSGKSAQADGKRYWGVVQKWDMTGHSRRPDANKCRTIGRRCERVERVREPNAARYRTGNRRCEAEEQMDATGDEMWTPRTRSECARPRAQQGGTVTRRGRTPSRWKFGHCCGRGRPHSGIPSRP